MNPNLYLRRDGDEFILSVEHRAASTIPAVRLDLAERENALALQVVERRTQPAQPVEPNSIDERITAALAGVGQPQSFANLRTHCRVRTATLYQRLAAMTAHGHLVRSADGYRLPTR